MREIDTFASGAHVALLDVGRGAGILIAPHPSQDVRLDHGQSLHEADWQSVIRPLVRGGWTFLSDEDDLPVTVANLPDGSVIHGLYPYLVEKSETPPRAAEDQEFSIVLMALVDTYAENQRPQEPRD